MSSDKSRTCVTRFHFNNVPIITIIIIIIIIIRLTKGLQTATQTSHMPRLCNSEFTSYNLILNLFLLTHRLITVNVCYIVLYVTNSLTCTSRWLLITK